LGRSSASGGGGGGGSSGGKSSGGKSTGGDAGTSTKDKSLSSKSGYAGSYMNSPKYRDYGAKSYYEYEKVYHMNFGYYMFTY